MRTIETTPRFNKNLVRFFKKHPDTVDSIKRLMVSLAKDPVSKKYKAHRLAGNLKGIWSARIDYSHRITYQYTSSTVVFFNIGSHDDVY
jgi:addiction module RelE/StbE family toxin